MDFLWLKLFLAPLLVVASTLAGRRWGPDITGIVVALPVVAGPILFITYQQHGANFAADAASSALLGLVSLATFAVVFSRAASRLGWLANLATSWAAVLAMDAVLSGIHVPTLAALALTSVATMAAIISMPRIAPEHPGNLERALPPRWDLPSRALATAVMVLAVTTASGALGPHWTGLLAPFPIATSVVAAFAHAQHGHASTTRTLIGTLMGLFSFGAFCVSITYLLRPTGGAAFLLGAAVAIAVQLLVIGARRTLTTRRLVGRV